MLVRVIAVRGGEGQVVGRGGWALVSSELLRHQEAPSPMNIIGKALAFVQSLEALARKTTWDWRRCPRCGQDDSIRYGTYAVHPWFLDGRQEVVIQRHKCNVCSRSGKMFTYSESSPYLVRGSWYAREVHRYSIDLWQHGRGSIRRSCEFVRSLLGRQERWLLWSA
jgi:transposase-like protein